ncbi:FMN-binding negative transcriptional regulator [Ramlibacter alkalitolerans]|uniref:FMN-binding negative transcriptional regulator n=1 Tax=Ramlibacter alkalitolerans TaxID=2039631 RepID=A0ABS1JTT8_9BURK|nr:FMN-binding negative transcriptional regulator [Ramlibacter alkalitolerans]MBL0427642.1 FMN-binding negative transcriptional regulator [Ramlibacter alkalitolerans]
MYQPKQFKSDEPAVAAELMRGHPFASLVSNDDSGFPFVTHLPLHLEERDGRFVLLGHVAKPNPHWRHLQARPEALVVFIGPHAYMSPTVYPDLQRVPTWNYLAVHCRVRARLLEDPVAKDGLLKKLIADHEPDYAAQWQGLGEEFALKMLAGIVAFELDVVEWACKLKVNQHRPEAHARMREIYAAGNEDERELGRWMQRLGLGRDPAK